jgi:anti-anti-sigma factor
MTAQQIRDAIVIVARGDLWEGEPCDDLERTLAEAATRGLPVIVDFAGVATITAHCLGLLAHAHDTAQRHGGSLVVCGAHGLQPWLFEETGLSRSIATYADREAALRAVGADPRAVA